MKNNLIELNNMLFDTLRDLNEGKIGKEKADAICKVSSNIIKNAKLQLNFVKVTKNTSMPMDVFGKKTIQIEGADIYDLKDSFAKSIGYDTVGKAIADMGNIDFDRQFKASEYYEKNS